MAGRGAGTSAARQPGPGPARPSPPGRQRLRVAPGRSSRGAGAAAGPSDRRPGPAQRLSLRHKVAEPAPLAARRPPGRRSVRLRRASRRRRGAAAGVERRPLPLDGPAGPGRLAQGAPIRRAAPTKAAAEAGLRAGGRRRRAPKAAGPAASGPRREGLGTGTRPEIDRPVRWAVQRTRKGRPGSDRAGPKGLPSAPRCPARATVRTAAGSLAERAGGPRRGSHGVQVGPIGPDACRGRPAC